MQTLITKAYHARFEHLLFNYLFETEIAIVHGGQQGCQNKFRI